MFCINPEERENSMEEYVEKDFMDVTKVIYSISIQTPLAQLQRCIHL